MESELQMANSKISQQQADIQSKVDIEKKLRAQINDLSSNSNSSEKQLQSKIAELDEQNDTLMADIAILKSDVDRQKTEITTLQQQNQKSQFQNEYTNHQLDQQTQKSQDLIEEINLINVCIKETEDQHEKVIEDKESQLRKL